MSLRAITLLVWIAFLIIISPCFGNESISQLTSEEKTWLNQNHTVRVRIGSAPPFMLTDGKLRGMAIDYLTYIFNLHGIEIQYIQESEVTWPQALTHIEQHDVVDMVPTAKITNERKKHMLFTNEYLFAPWVIFTRSNSDFIGSIEDLKGRTVSVEEGYVMHEKLKQDYPEIKLKVISAKLQNYAEIPVSDLSSGLVDAYIGNLIMTTYMIQSKGYTNLKVAAPTPFDNHNQAMAMRSDWPELASIINKTLAGMTPDEHATILNRWLSIRYEYGINKIDILKWILGIISISAIILLVIIVWNRKLQKEIIEHKLTEEKLKESETRLNFFLKNSPIGFGIWDSNFKYVYINKVLQEINGPSIEEHIGHTIEEVLPKAAPVLRPLFKKIISSSNPILNIELSGEVPSRPGKISHYLASYFPILLNDKKSQLIGGVVMDITERKLMDDKLKESEEKYRRLSVNSPAIVYQFKMESGGRFSVPYINESVNSIMDVAAEDIMQDASEFLAMVHPEDQEMFLEGVLKSAESLELYHTVIRYLKDGEERWIEARSTPDTMEDGSVIWDGFLIDITDKKKAEKERDVLESRLLQSQKIESIGTLAGGIAHDFNNILYPIIGFTQLSQDELPANHPVQDNLQDVLDGAKRARDLIKRILLFSRQQDQIFKPTSLKPIIEDTLKLLRSSIPANINIQSNLYDSDDCVMCDATQINEIVMNLCTNSYHALEDHGGEIIVDLNKTQPDDSLNLHPGKYICLSVADNGSGIPENLIDKIFEPYFTTKEIGKGSGLGLSVVHGIVKNYKGEIIVKSKPDEGSTFKIFLPLTTSHGKLKDKKKNKDSFQGTEEILFVDDEKVIIKLGIRSLERLGYILTGIQDSTEALDLVASDPDRFDMVITDMAMPKLEGLQLSKKIYEINPAIPIIICSGYSEKLDKTTTQTPNIKAIIDKPILVENLTKKVREILDLNLANRT